MEDIEMLIADNAERYRQYHRNRLNAYYEGLERNAERLKRRAERLKRNIEMAAAGCALIAMIIPPAVHFATKAPKNEYEPSQVENSIVLPDNEKGCTNAGKSIDDIVKDEQETVVREAKENLEKRAKGPEHYSKPLGKNPYTEIIGKWANAVEPAAKKWGVDPSLVYAIIYAESGGNQSCRSSAGAIGVMQLMPNTAKGLGVNPYDPIENIEGGVREIASNLKRYSGDLELSLAAYNAGPGNVRKYGGIPPFREAQRYVPKVLRAKRQFEKRRAKYPGLN